MITNIIILICAIIFIYINFISKLDKTDCAIRLGAFYPPRIKNNKEYYRFITCNFIHIDFIHFFMNAYCIYSLGGFFESLLGTVGYLYLVILSMLASSLMTYSFSYINEKYDYTMTIGASGLFFGYLGAMIALAILLGGAYAELLYSFASVILINVIFTLFSPSISKTGHLGGAIGGFVAIVVLMLVGLI
jgi:rhomboid protease GluP